METLPTLLANTKAIVIAACETLSPEETVTVARRYLPDSELKSFSTLRIDISPGGNAIDMANRSELQSGQKVGVVFRQLLPAGMQPDDESSNEWIDGRLAVVFKIVKALYAADFDIASLTELANAPQYDADALRKERLFLSFITLTLTSIE